MSCELTKFIRLYRIPKIFNKFTNSQFNIANQHSSIGNKDKDISLYEHDFFLNCFLKFLLPQRNTYVYYSQFHMYKYIYDKRLESLLSISNINVFLIFINYFLIFINDLIYKY